MSHIALYILAFTHDPVPQDVYRFGFMPEPHICYPMVNVPMPYKMWQLSCKYEQYIERVWQNNWLPQRADFLRCEFIAAQRTKQAWNHLAAMTDTTYAWRYRLDHAIALRHLLGPVDYFTGRLPEPWPLGEE